jgi:predicted transcriptional regulator
MDTHTPDTVTLKLSPELAKRLEEMAREQQRPLIDIAQETFENALLNTDLDDEDSDEEILAALRESLEEAKRGEWLDFDEVLAEMKRKYHADNH